MKYESPDGKRMLEIIQDTYPDSPREWSNLGKMICFHKGYNLGDETHLESSDFGGWDGLEHHLYDEEKAIIVLPLYLYDHSGITIKIGPFNCPWDSGQVGFIYATEEDLKKEGVTKERIEKILRTEVETYDQYLRGDIYGFVLHEVKECELGYTHYENMDSCWGFYGTDWVENGLLEHTGIKDFEDWEELDD